MVDRRLSAGPIICKPLLERAGEPCGLLLLLLYAIGSMTLLTLLRFCVRVGVPGGVPAAPAATGRAGEEAERTFCWGCGVLNVARLRGVAGGGVEGGGAEGGGVAGGGVAGGAVSLVEASGTVNTGGTG